MSKIKIAANAAQKAAGQDEATAKNTTATSRPLNAKERAEAVAKAKVKLDEIRQKYNGEQHKAIQDDLAAHCDPVGFLPDYQYTPIEDMFKNGGKVLPKNMSSAARLILNILRRHENEHQIYDAIFDTAADAISRLTKGYEEKGLSVKPSNRSPWTCPYKLPMHWDELINALPQELKDTIVSDLNNNGYLHGEPSTAKDFYVLHLLMVLAGNLEDGWNTDELIAEAYDVFVAAMGTKPVYRSK